ncbi:hypothetical protein AMAG_13221 [Allomyces macrogynus ATCC 38327]|uniref:Uncharacterized protein n=1 Tax=Allomyces macrogynus (strain ATCC 38327) TaxID=578462 RepID=A0A0L0SZX5_ALLM3|nr:hypothetical protein AMAG_13221 [Allomyces macrogynus ATCC 38327]|eukprot:KNE68047.1 hypothetical protein AMAG_13221 [Allomyces macrogynus ATCC 38327]
MGKAKQKAQIVYRPVNPWDKPAPVPGAGKAKGGAAAAAAAAAEKDTSVVKITRDETMDEAADLTKVKKTTPMKKKGGKKQSAQLDKAMARAEQLEEKANKNERKRLDKQKRKVLWD